jgi:hypothetical protein
VGVGTGFDFVSRSPPNSVQMPAKQKNGLLSSSANQTTSFFFVSVRLGRVLGEAVADFRYGAVASFSVGRLDVR